MLRKLCAKYIQLFKVRCIEEWFWLSLEMTCCAVFTGLLIKFELVDFIRFPSTVHQLSPSVKYKKRNGIPVARRWDSLLGISNVSRTFPRNSCSSYQSYETHWFYIDVKVKAYELHCTISVRVLWRPIWRTKFGQVRLEQRGNPREPKAPNELSRLNTIIQLKSVSSLSSRLRASEFQIGQSRQTSIQLLCQANTKILRLWKNSQL